VVENSIFLCFWEGFKDDTCMFVEEGTSSSVELPSVLVLGMKGFYVSRLALFWCSAR